MSKHTLRVIVIGGGIMGASAAWNLARQGAQVTLLEKESQPAKGATGWSYGWIGTGSALPSEPPARFALKMEAMSAYKQLEQHFGTLPIAARGAIVCATERELFLRTSWSWRTRYQQGHWQQHWEFLCQCMKNQRSSCASQPNQGSSATCCMGRMSNSGQPSAETCCRLWTAPKIQ